VVIGFTGSFHPFHGAPVLAEAFVRVADADSRVRLLLVGDGEEREEVERILLAAGHTDKARLLGTVERERIPALLSACDVLASPHVGFEDGTPFFGSPTKLFEYMAAGKAIVASRLGQIEEVLEHEGSALLVEPANVEELRGALLRLIDDPRLRSELGRNAREAAAQHTWGHTARRVLDSFAGLQLTGTP
jgi:glycosyltransferase involved in cell wall biosynthesis